MKSEKLQNDSLEQFITLILPEGKIIESKNSELTAISKLIISVVNSIGLSTTIEAVFNVFYKLHYSMSVVEPRQEKDSKPYRDTNSHAIYIGVNADKLTQLSDYVNFTLNENTVLPEALLYIDRLLQQFKEQ